MFYVFFSKRKFALVFVTIKKIENVVTALYISSSERERECSTSIISVSKVLSFSAPFVFVSPQIFKTKGLVFYYESKKKKPILTDVVVANLFYFKVQTDTLVI